MVFEHEPFIIKQNIGAPDPQHPPTYMWGAVRGRLKKNTKKKKDFSQSKISGGGGGHPHWGSKSFFKTKALT